MLSNCFVQYTEKRRARERWGGGAEKERNKEKKSTQTKTRAFVFYGHHHLQCLQRTVRSSAGRATFECFFFLFILLLIAVLVGCFSVYNNFFLFENVKTARNEHVTVFMFSIAHSKNIKTSKLNH